MNKHTSHFQLLCVKLDMDPLDYVKMCEKKPSLFKVKDELHAIGGENKR